MNGKNSLAQYSRQPIDEAEHFFKCKLCGGYFNIFDYGAVLDHEEPLPHPACDQAQYNMRDRGREASPRRRLILVGWSAPAKFERATGLR